MKACIPMAIQVVIDDVGWWSGEDSSAQGGPYRSGCGRDHVVADYEAIIELGRRLGMRPQAAMVLCEWDRDNILRALPSSTWMGERWDNSLRLGPWLDEAADLLRRQAAHIELAVHGVGHEFWSGDEVSRAEWHDRQGHMRPEPAVRAHLDIFSRLFIQNGLGTFPSFFVPAAFLHRFGGELAGILAEYGIRYLSTPFSRMFRSRDPEDIYFGVEAGVLTVDRGLDLIKWNVTGAQPAGGLEGPVCGMHWPNLLHADPARNAEAVEHWVKLLQPYDLRFDRMLAPDTASGFSQLLYHRWTEIVCEESSAKMDFRKVDTAGVTGLLDSFYLKVRAGEGARFTADGVTIMAARREADQWRLHLHREPGRGQGQVIWNGLPK
jgi:hypothetical protein